MADVFEYRGIENLVYAEVTGDDNESSGGYVTGEVKPLAPVAQIARTTETASESHYYDNKPLIVIASEGADTVTITTAGVPLEVLAEITGKKYDSEKGAMIEGQRTNKYFAIGYIAEKTDGTKMYVWRYKGQFGIPDDNYATKNNGTEANGVELTYTGIMTTHEFTNGGSAKAMVVDSGIDKADLTTFFDAVTTPDTLAPKA